METSPERRIAPLSAFEGVRVDQGGYERVAAHYQGLVEGLTDLLERAKAADDSRLVVPMRDPLQAALTELRQIVASAGGMCTKAPPPVPIAPVVNAGGGLIMECSHKTPHRWDMNGNPI